MKKAIKKIKKYAVGGAIEDLETLDGILTEDPNKPTKTNPTPAKPTPPDQVSEEQWLMLKNKYTEGLPQVKPYGAPTKGSALDKRMKWITWANQKLPTSGTPTELSARAAKQAGIDPGMLLASSLEEGVGLRFMGQGNDYSNAYVAANKKGELKDYPVDAFRNYGLDQVAGRIDDFIKKGWVPADIKNKMKAFNASNELDEKEYYQKAYNVIKGYEGLGNFTFSSNRATYDKIDKILDEYEIEGVPEMKTSAQTAAFKDDESAYYAKAAFLRSEQENVLNYAKQKGYKLTPEEQQFFTMSSYNGGFGNARQMLDYYGGKKELGNNAFYKDRGNKGQIYDNIMPRFAGSRLFTGEGYFEYGGKVPKKPKGVSKYLDGGPVDPFNPTGILSGSNNWINTNSGTVPINPSGISAIPLQNQVGTAVGQGNIVPLSEFYNVVNGPNGNQIMQSTGQYVNAEGQTTTPAEQQMIADQVSVQNRSNAMEREGVMDDIETVASTSMAAINAFFQRNNAAQADRSGRRRSIQQTMLAQMNPYLEGTGSQAIMKKGGKLKYKNGGEIQGDEFGIKTIDGGTSKMISSSDHSNPMIQFTGKTHDQGGISLQYGGSMAEVENDEVGWVDNNGGLNIFGKLKMPGTNQTFKNIAKSIAKEENKIDGEKAKFLNILNNSNSADPYQESALSTSKVMFKSLDKQSKEIVQKKEALASYQNLILGMVEQGQKMKYGGSLPPIPAIPKMTTGGVLEGPDDPNDVKAVQAFIDKNSGGKSPLKAEDFIEVSKKYSVPLDLMLAQATQESNFGTKGRAVRTKNIFNIGNTDDGTANDMGDWKKGLENYAKTLSKEYSKDGKINTQDLLNNGFTRTKDRARYATDPKYTAKLSAILDEINPRNTYSYMNSYAGNDGPVGRSLNIPLISTTDIMKDYKPINIPISGNSEPVVQTKYGAAKRDATPFSDKAVITSGGREREYQSPLDVEQIAPELISLATNQRQAVPGFSYQPGLQQTFDISYQLGRNENESTFRQASALAEQTGNMDVLAQLAAQKYKADQQYNMQEIQGNAQQRLQTYAQNIATLNDAKLKNIALASDQQAKQTQADYNTKLQDMAAIKSITGKVEQNKLENKTYNAYANLFQNYGFDSKGNVTFDIGKVAKKFTAGEAQAFGMMAAQQGAQAILNGDFSRQFTKVKNTDGSQTTTETLGTNKKIQEEYNALKKQGFDDALIGNMLRAKYPETISQ